MLQSPRPRRWAAKRSVDHVVVEQLALGQPRAAHGRLRVVAERTSQPLLHGAAEALLRPREDLGWQRVAHRLAQDVLALTVAVLHVRRQRHRELDELVIEERLAPLDRARHRDAVHARQQQLGQPLAQLEVGHALEEVGVAAPGAALVPDALDRAQRAVIAIAQEAAP